MSALLAVDPGIRGCGCALFDGVGSKGGGYLVKAAYVVNPAHEGNRAAEAAAMGRAVFYAMWSGPPQPSELAVEWPRVYASRIRSGASPGDPNDLLALAAVVTAVVAASTLPADRATSYAPSEWKGQLDKSVMARRIEARLTADELVVYEAARAKSRSKFHNVIDSVGIGLHHVGRLGKVRVIEGKAA